MRKYRCERSEMKYENEKYLNKSDGWQLAARLVIRVNNFFGCVNPNSTIMVEDSVGFKICYAHIKKFNWKSPKEITLTATEVSACNYFHRQRWPWQIRALVWQCITSIISATKRTTEVLHSHIHKNTDSLQWPFRYRHISTQWKL